MKSTAGKPRTKIAMLVAALLTSAASAAIVTGEPRVWERSDRFGSNAPQRERNVAGEFDYYALVLSWSPTFCSTASDRDAMQCDRRDGRRFNFVLHGLWPQYERGYPGDCRTARRPFVPQPIINSMLDIMPSPGLVTHEYRKHGTCSGLDPQAYFALSRRLFEQVRIPEKLKNPFETQTLGLDEIARGFLKANPGLEPEQFAIACAGGRNGRLKEVRFCFTKDGQPRNCGDNENQRRMCSADQVYVPPVRSTAREDAFGEPRRAVPPPAPAANDPRRPLPGFRPL